MYRRSVNHLAIVVLRHPDSKAQLCKFLHHTSSFNNPQQDRFYLSTLLLYHTSPHPDQLHPARPTFTPTKKTTNRRSQSWSKIFKIAIFWSWYYSGEWWPRERSGWGKRESGEVQLLHKWGFFNCHSIPFIFLIFYYMSYYSLKTNHQIYNSQPLQQSWIFWLLSQQIWKMGVCAILIDRIW